MGDWEVTYRSSTIGDGRGSEDALKKTESDEHTDIGTDRARDSENDKADVANLIDPYPTVQLRQWSEKERAKGKAEDINGNYEASQQSIIVLELSHQLGNAWGENNRP